MNQIVLDLNKLNRKKVASNSNWISN